MMCTNKRWITNKYTGDKFFVKCGHCKSCLQEKAIMNTNRIRREFDGKRIALFVTLTYDRFSCPYILEQDFLNKEPVLNIYRDCDVYRNARTGRYKRIYDQFKLDSVCVFDSFDSDGKPDYFVGRYKWLKKQPHKVGVTYFKDFQNFVKRLRINCSRSFINHEGFTIFDCSEYGSRSLRPHFHFLLFISPDDDAFYREAICKAWPFAGQRRTRQYIELSRDPASYVASYVNCTHSISAFFAKYFKPKHSFSHYFGTSDPQFSLPSLLSKINKGNLDYVVSRIKQGKSDAHLLIPKYVINRYFPVFKGYFRLDDNEVYNHLLTAGIGLYGSDYLRKDRKFQGVEKWKIDSLKLPSDGSCKVFKRLDGTYDLYRKINYSFDDVRHINRLLLNARSRFIRETGLNKYDFVIYHQAVWRLYKSCSLKAYWEDVNILTLERYDNLFEVDSQVIHNDYYHDLLAGCEYVPLNPNEFRCNLDSTANNCRYFELYDKSKKVSNEIMVANGHFV